MHRSSRPCRDGEQPHTTTSCGVWTATLNRLDSLGLRSATAPLYLRVLPPPITIVQLGRIPGAESEI